MPNANMDGKQQFYWECQRKKIDDDDSRIRKTSTRADYYIARPITKLNCTIINTPKRRSKGILLLSTYIRSVILVVVLTKTDWLSDWIFRIVREVEFAIRS